MSKKVKKVTFAPDTTPTVPATRRGKKRSRLSKSAKKPKPYKDTLSAIAQKHIFEACFKAEGFGEVCRSIDFQRAIDHRDLSKDNLELLMNKKVADAVISMLILSKAPTSFPKKAALQPDASDGKFMHRAMIEALKEVPGGKDCTDDLTAILDRTFSEPWGSEFVMEALQ